LKILALILAGGTGRELSVLTYDRAKTALPFGGSYRIIDFCLSNCVHSGIDTIAILAQYSPRSLIDHIGIGKPWDLDRKNGGVFILQPNQYGMAASWYRGTADAVYQNIDMIMNTRAELVLILSGDHIYKMDYREMADAHIKSGKPMTVALKKMQRNYVGRFGMARCDNDGSVVSFKEKPKSSGFDHASMGIYMFDKEYLLKLLETPKVDIVFDILIPMISKKKVNAYIFNGYWEDVGSISSYFNASMKLLRGSSMLFSKKWPIYTRPPEMPPAKFLPGSLVKESIVASGCIVEGEVRKSILFPGVVIRKGAKVTNSIVFSFSTVSKEAVVDRAILDKFVDIGKGARVGTEKVDRVKLEHLCRSGLMHKGEGRITVIGKRARIRPGRLVPQGIIVETGATIK